MPVYLNTNIASLNAQRNLLGSTSGLNKTLSRLSSGLRINTAGDDAAGLAISNRMTTQIRGLNQAVVNANDGISVSQVAEGALSEHSNMLQRMNELAVQSANATNSPQDRRNLQQEVSQLLAEIERVAQETEFNGWPMLNGETDPLVFQVGAKENQTIIVTLADARANVLLSQSQLTDPNSKQSIYNPRIAGLQISAPDMLSAGSKLFSSKAGMMINSVASADVGEGKLGTSNSANIAKNMFTSINSPFADQLAIKLNSITNVFAVPTQKSAIVQALEGITGTATVNSVVDAIVGSTNQAVRKIVNDGIANGDNARTISDNLKAEGTVITNANKLAVATLAMYGRSADGRTQIVGGGSIENAISGIIATELMEYDYTLGNGKQSLNSDQARVIAAATYTAGGDYSSTDNVPSEYQALAGVPTIKNVTTIQSSTNLVPTFAEYIKSKGLNPETETSLSLSLSSGMVPLFVIPTGLNNVTFFNYVFRDGFGLK